MIRYTKNDMKVLYEISVEGSPARVFIKEAGFDPKKFLGILQKFNLRKDINFLYHLPLKDVPLLLNKGEISGYLKFRLHVNK